MGSFCRILAGCAVALALGVPPDVAAQARHGYTPGRAPAWRGDIRQFPQHDWQVWRGGHWVHARHDGHLGWWWVIGATWYFYPAPVYPYPNPYEPPPPPAPAAAMPPAAQYWYFCEAAQAYYPYVPSCPGGWKQVPATPPGESP